MTFGGHEIRHSYNILLETCSNLGCSFQKHRKPKLIIEQLPPMVSMINFDLTVLLGSSDHDSKTIGSVQFINKLFGAISQPILIGSSKIQLFHEYVVE